MDEKIYLTDKGLSASDVAAMMGSQNNGMGGQWNNPFIYLVWMMFAGRFFGNGWNGENGGGLNPQIASLQNQMQDNHNSDLILQGIGGNTNAIRELATNLNCDFQTLNASICDVRNGIDKVGCQVGYSAERVINSVNMGDCRIIEALNACCCNTQKELLSMKGDFQLQMCNQTNALSGGQNRIMAAIDRGFSATAFETKSQTCELINNQNNNTQRIIDTLNGHWSDELRERLAKAELELSQSKQSAYIIERLVNCSGK